MTTLLNHLPNIPQIFTPSGQNSEKQSNQIK